MSNIHSLNQTPTNPAMAEAFLQAATKNKSPEIGGDTLQAELANMEQVKPEPDTTASRLAKSLASMNAGVKNVSDKVNEVKEEIMHHTDGSDNMFAEVEEIMEPEFTGSHSRVKAMALMVAGSGLAATAVGALFTRDGKTIKNMAISSLVSGSALVGMEAIKAKCAPSIADRMTMGKKRSAKLLGGGMLIGAVTTTICLSVARIFNSGE
ncbi:hypothetical protein AH06_145 [Erwinia phage AH06]|nr:hypothetical protein AH06_145 [Erwinia phage AH06]